MKVLVTGGAGYIGSHCAIAMMEKGHDVVILDNFCVGHEEIVKTIENIKAPGKFSGTIKADITDSDELKNVFGGIDAVVHFAAFSYVGESIKEPKKYYRNNVTGTINLLDAMLENNIKIIVFSSTAAVYGEPEYVPIDEETPARPINPYGSTKLEAERIIESFDGSGIKSVCLRYFNVAGADSKCRVGEWHEPETHLIPNILRSTFGNGKEFELYGNDYPTRDGTCVRDYINIEDLADAHILALEYLSAGGNTDRFNLGTNDGNTVLEVFAECENVTGKKIPLKVMPRRAGDPAALVADNRKAKRVLGWRPKRTLRHTIETAYAWEKKLTELRK